VHGEEAQAEYVAMLADASVDGSTGHVFDRHAAPRQRTPSSALANGRCGNAISVVRCGVVTYVYPAAIVSTTSIRATTSRSPSPSRSQSGPWSLRSASAAL
jgi:hypothetical protein